MTTVRFRNSAFTLAEMLVACLLSAIVIGGAAGAYHVIVSGQRKYVDVSTVNLPSGARANFYNVTGNSQPAYIAPNFGSVSKAEALRELFMEDISQAVGVYCLARAENKLNTVRPATIPTPTDSSVLDSPKSFRAYLNSVIPAAASIFTTDSNAPTLPNFSIYILGYSSNASTIPVIAVYDMDLVKATDPKKTSSVVGTYCSVRRYVSGSLTSYYDVLFTAGDGSDSFTPSIVSFERRARRAVNEGEAVDRFKKAAGKPFYFVFWPDPAQRTLELPGGRAVNVVPGLNKDYLNSDPRKAYNHMAGRTSYWFTVPMFPSF